VENQVGALSKVAEARGWQIVATFRDEGISGAKGRRDRPGLDEMLKQAQRGKFDVVMAWAIAGRLASDNRKSESVQRRFVS
jgi:DNA invertase Pin-like site-specific DNA recombinase